MNKNNKEKIDVTKQMRSIRDAVSSEIQNMSFKQEKNYIAKQLKALKS